MLTIYKLFFKNIKYLLTIGFIVTLWSTSAWSQTDLKIGNAPGTITNSAVFEAASTTKGMLIPRMTTAQMNAISSPANGLTIYNTSDSSIYLYRNSLWQNTSSATYALSWGLLGNASTNPASNFLGTTDNQSLAFRTNNTERMRLNTSGYLGIGTALPSYKLDIDANTGGSGNPIRLQGLQAGATADSIITSSSGILRRMSTNSLAWTLTGNSGTVDGTNFIGTTDNIPFSIRVNNLKAGRIDHLLNNTFFGYTAGNVNSTGTENTYIGGQAGISNTTGIRNVNIGYQSGRNGIHSHSIAIGYQAGLQNASSNNIFLGTASGAFTSTGADNIAMGYYSFFANTTGGNNVAIGTSALTTLSNGWGNTAVGYRSMISTQTGQANVALGDSSLFNNTIGSNNTALGYRAGLTLTTGSNNTFLGYGADVSSAALTNATALGYNAVVGASNSLVLGGTGANAVSVGINTTTPQYKLDIDAQTGTAGNPLRLLGLNAGSTADSIISSSSGILRRLSIAQVIGNSWNILGNSSTVDGTNFIGTTDNIPLSIRVNNQKSGRIGIVGETYLGYQAGNAVTSGQNNTLLGYQAGVVMTNAWGNTAIGYRSLYLNTTGGGNVAIGDSALSVNTTASNNSALGYRAGLTSATGSNNTFLGATSDVSSSALTNATAVGYGASVTASNKIRLGNSSVTLVETSGSFVTVSDRRLKTNIEDNYIGLNFIKAMRPVKYELKAQKGIVYDGFIAQEIDSILQKQNIKTFSGLAKPANTEGYYTVSYATFVVPLVNAVKELDAKSEATQKENAALKAELERMKTENAVLKASVDKNTQDIEAIKAALKKQ